MQCGKQNANLWSDPAGLFLTGWALVGKSELHLSKAIVLLFYREVKAAISFQTCVLISRNASTL